MNIAMKVDPANALNGDFAPDKQHPGWVQGWGVIKGPPRDREFAGIFVERDSAEAAAAKAGPGFAARWGSYNASTQDYITGDTEDGF
jgi:hypothetical protein